MVIAHIFLFLYCSSFWLDSVFDVHFFGDSPLQILKKPAGEPHQINKTRGMKTKKLVNLEKQNFFWITKREKCNQTGTPFFMHKKYKCVYSFVIYNEQSIFRHLFVWNFEMGKIFLKSTEKSPWTWSPKQIWIFPRGRNI